MSNIKALIVGVSDYTLIEENNLPFCRNDITIMQNALENGLKVESDNLIICGKNAVVTASDFINALNNLAQIATVDDTVIFYFSGHGTTQISNHYLVFSDKIISTKEIIEFIEKIKAKNKIIILDSCMSGNFAIDGTATFNIGETVDEFAGKGYAVLASSNAEQYSYPHPDKRVSLFTSFLCEALEDKHIIRNGKKSLYDINRLVSLYLEIWNKRNQSKQQQPIFRANIGGTIFFKVEEYVPYIQENIFDDTEKYTVYDVKPVHSIAKRYSVSVILKEPFSFDEMSDISIELIEKIKKVEVYSNVASEKRWIGQDANIIWIYYGRDESDIINSNYICHTTWVDDEQDKQHWYPLDQNSFIKKNIHFNIHSYYELLKDFNLKNTGDRNKLLSDGTEIMRRLIMLAEKAIALYNELKNQNITEDVMIQKMKILIPMISEAYFEVSNLNIAPNELHNWKQGILNLAATIHDFTYFYNSDFMLQRTPENRLACMDMTIRRYYNELEQLKCLENEI